MSMHGGYVFAAAIFIFGCLWTTATGGETAPQDVTVVEGEDSAAPDDQAVEEPEREPVFAPVRDKGLEEFEAEPFELASPLRPEKKVAGETEGPKPWDIVTRLAVSLLALTGLLWAGITLARKFLPGSNQIFNSPAAEILSRSHLDSKRYIALVRVGGRVMVVGVSPEGLSSLGEIADNEEVAEIMRQARPRTEAGKSIFKSLLSRSVESRQGNKDNDNHPAAENSGGEKERLTREMEDISEKLRNLRGDT